MLGVEGLHKSTCCVVEAGRHALASAILPSKAIPKDESTSRIRPRVDFEHRRYRSTTQTIKLAAILFPPCSRTRPKHVYFGAPPQRTGSTRNRIKKSKNGRLNQNRTGLMHDVIHFLSGRHYRRHGPINESCGMVSPLHRLRCVRANCKHYYCCTL